MWKCIVKLCTNNASLLAQSEMDQIQWLLLNLCGTIRDMDYDDSDCFERNIKVALFHAKIMLRLYQLFAPKMPRCHFERYAELLLLLKEYVTWKYNYLCRLYILSCIIYTESFRPLITIIAKHCLV